MKALDWVNVQDWNLHCYITSLERRRFNRVTLYEVNLGNLTVLRDIIFAEISRIHRVHSSENTSSSVRMSLNNSADTSWSFIRTWLSGLLKQLAHLCYLVFSVYFIQLIFCIVDILQITRARGSADLSRTVRYLTTGPFLRHKRWASIYNQCKVLVLLLLELLWWWWDCLCQGPEVLVDIFALVERERSWKLLWREESLWLSLGTFGFENLAQGVASWAWSCIDSIWLF